jgi:vitamin B12/bleomycin/antimicrobial peptide transport system ATP-binding/permease protein
MGLFLVLAGSSMAVAVFQLYVRQLLQLHWRRWLVFRLQRRWLEGGRHYQLNFLPDAADNPDQRMSENTRWATAMAVDMAVGVITSVLMLVSFVGILWTLSGPLHVAFGANEFDIPGYMVWAALLYAGIGSGLTWLIGRPMVEANIRRNEAEGDHRFALIRLRENSEGVALIRGERDEDRGLRGAFEHVVAVMKDLMRSERNLMWLTSAYGMLLTVFPILVASPRYFAGAITLGVLFQISNAFGQVQGALSWFVESYASLADWKASVDRLLTFDRVLRETAAEAERDGGVRVVPDAAGKIRAEDVDLVLPNGRVVLSDAAFTIEPGDRVLLRGPTGSGKSTLFRAMAGIWPFGRWRIHVPEQARVLFLPQKPYIPIGSLRDAVAYPAAGRDFPDAAICEVLEAVNLGHLAARLDEAQNWSMQLSGGEQQRLAIARALLHRPDWLFLDEATSALDGATEERVYELLRERLAGTTIVSIAHRPGVDGFHDATIELVPSEAGATLRSTRRAEPVAAPAGTQAITAG